MTKNSRQGTFTGNNTTNCIRCGLCLAVCPTYQVYLNEATSPRGRVMLARKGLSGELELSQALMEEMYSCFACMACDEICPAGVRPAELALKMRTIQEQLHPVAWKKALFKELIPKPGRMELATWPLRTYQRLGIRRLVYTLGMQKWLPGQLGDVEAMLPRLPQRPLRRVLPEIVPAEGEKRYRIGFFLGCAQSLLFADQSSAAVRVLARNGCTIKTPKEAVCCGMPAKGYGRDDLVQEQARKNIRIFEQADVDVIVTDCATCGSTLKEYGQILSGDEEWAHRAVSFSEKVRDISEFLISIPLRKPEGRLAGKVTYHDPCHLRRGQGVWKEPRRLLGMIEGIELVELAEADVCCGSAGSQLITHYETSRKMIDRKVDHLERTGAQFVASGCPGCQMQLSAGLRRRKLDMEVVHPVELLERAYQAETNHRNQAK